MRWVAEFLSTAGEEKIKSYYHPSEDLSEVRYGMGQFVLSQSSSPARWMLPVPQKP